MLLGRLKSLVIRSLMYTTTAVNNEWINTGKNIVLCTEPFENLKTKGHLRCLSAFIQIIGGRLTFSPSSLNYLPRDMSFVDFDEPLHQDS